jgi:ferrochelatase
MNEKETAIVLMNLGSPDSPEPADVKKYLLEFLMDERVIDKGEFYRSLLVKGIIVPFRYKKSAHAYNTIWWEDGSPLVVITQRQQQKLKEKFGGMVEIAMRYGSLTPQKAFDTIEKNKNIKEVVLVPMYPHYAMSSFETAVVHAQKQFNEGGYNFKLRIVKPFYNNPSYIEALADSMKPYLNSNYDKILFSYHGIPQRHVEKCDTTGSHCFKVDDCCNVKSKAHETCYRHQCFETTRLVTEKLGIEKTKYEISFQSRLGSVWLTPFTDVVLQEMPQRAVKNLLVICPAFVSDCLETLEEIAVRGKEDFIKAGGENYEMITCMNDNDSWIDAIKLIAEQS